MSTHTRIRPARGLQRFVWRALRIRRWMTAVSLVSISGGDVESQVGQARKYLYALSRAGIVYRRPAGREASGCWCATLVRRHPSTDVVQVSCTTITRGQELPCGNNSRKPLDDTNAVTRHSIDHLRS